MKWLYIMLLLTDLICFLGSRNKEYPKMNFLPSPHKVYLCCRGTAQKQGLVAKQFNFSDTNITHIGIGFTSQDGFRIYHVSDVKSNGNYFQHDSLSGFIAEKGTRFFSAWEIEAPEGILEKIKTACLSESNYRIIFDTHFSFHNGDTLYCSEFCRNVLLQAGLDCSFPTRISNLQGDFYKIYFGMDSLRYVPVDFFISCNRVKLVYESSFPVF